MSLRTLLLGAAILALGCGDSPTAAPPPVTLVQVDSARLMRVVSALAHDSMMGRATGTAGAESARRLIVQELIGHGVAPLQGSYEHDFAWPVIEPPRYTGTNVLALIPGTERPDTYILVSAHYDHVGSGPAGVYNGADDNASGTAALLELAAALRERGPRHSILLAAFDAEEVGLEGSASFVRTPPVPLDRIALVINLDMMGRSRSRTLYAAGTRYTPELRQFVDPEVARATVALRYGLDGTSGLPDYTFRSDQAAFHLAGIPFILFSVADDPVYHTVDDDFETLHLGFYTAAVRLAANVAWRADQRLEQVLN